VNARAPDLPATSEPGELVVDVLYLDLVAKALGPNGGLRLTCKEIDRSDELGLALLRLEDADGQPAVLDAVLSELRWRFAAEYGGWTPAMGKNRNISGQIGGFPETEPIKPPKMAAGGDPVPTRPENAPRWDWSSQTGKGVRVGILDTKIYPHGQLRDRYVLMDHDAELTPRPGEPVSFRAGHAAFIAGLILQQAPAAELHVRWVLDEQMGRATLWETVKKMALFANDGVDILNVSLGCLTADGQPPLVVRRAIERLNRDLVVVAAAGNHGGTTRMVEGTTNRSQTWPAALRDVVAVGATKPEDLEPDDGFFSPQLPWITVTAPGVDAVSAYLDGPVELSDGKIQQFDGSAVWSGTSFAAATVSGAIAARARPGEAQQALHDILTGGVQSVVRKYVHAP
jgi:membrane-anchored mycosin MYCP